MKKDIATSLTSLVFLVVGISGVMMYFHLFDSYVKDLHEILGLLFFVAALFHVMFNFKQMKQYLSKKIFISLAIVISIISAGFIFDASTKGENPKRTIIVSLLKAPIETSFDVLKLDYDMVLVKLQEAAIEYQDEASIMQLAKNNNKSPFEVVGILTKQ